MLFFMLRRVAPAGCMLAALALAAGACDTASSRKATPGAGGGAGMVGGAGTGGAAGDGSGSGRGGESRGGANSANGAGFGGLGAGTSAGAGGTGGGAGAGGTAGSPEAGAAGSTESEGTGGPAWIPTGVFGANADATVEAIRDYLEAICRTGLCLGSDDEEAVARCIEAEFHNFAPSAEWLACASRADDAFDSYLAALTQYYRGCTRSDGSDCDVSICLEPAPSQTFDGCPPFNERPFTCRNRIDTFIRCNDESDCPDGYDERNCDPAAESYLCTDGTGIDWHALCDGTEDCADGVDEFRCEP
jgi:hypothetical protein